MKNCFLSYATNKRWENEKIYAQIIAFSQVIYSRFVGGLTLMLDIINNLEN